MIKTFYLIVSPSRPPKIVTREPQTSYGPPKLRIKADEIVFPIDIKFSNAWRSISKERIRIEMPDPAAIPPIEVK